MNKFKAFKAAVRRITRYRQARYVLYAFIYFVWLPLRYLSILLMGWITAIIEETRDTAVSMVGEYRDLARILKQERANAQLDRDNRAATEIKE